MTEVGRDPGRDAAAPDLVLGPRHDRRRGADQDAAPERPQLREPHPHRARRAARHPRRQHRRRRQPRLARLGVVLGQRPAPARQQLHARRRRQQRDLAADGRDLPERRCPRRVQAADQHLLGRVRQVARRRRQPADQVGHQPVPRQRVRVPAQRRRSTPTTGSTTGRAARSRTSSRTSSAAPSAARSSRTRRSSSRTTRACASTTGQTLPLDGADAQDAQGRLLRAQPRHLRPAHRPAVPGQHHPAEPLGSRVRRTSSSSSTPSRTPRAPYGRDRPDDQQLPDQPRRSSGRTTSSTSRSTTG